MLVAPPATGKTVIAAHLIAARDLNTLVLVHRKPLADQWVARLAAFFDIAPKKIGLIGGGKRRPTGTIDVATVQSLVRRGRVADVVAQYGHVIVDECHHVSAASFERVLSEAKARYVLGLTATPRRRDGHHPIVEMQLGPVRFAIAARAQAAQRGFAHRLHVTETGFQAQWTREEGIQSLYAKLAADETRNALVLDAVIGALAEGRSPLPLTERRDHLELLAAKLRPATRHLVVLHGGLSPKERRTAMSALASIPVLHRLHAGKTEVRILDFLDRNVPVLAKMFTKRLRGYRALGYVQDSESPNARTTRELSIGARTPTARKGRAHHVPRRTSQIGFPAALDLLRRPLR